MDLLCAKEVASLLGISLQTFYRNFRAWGIPYFMLGGNIRFQEKEILKFISHHKQKMTPLGISLIKHARQRRIHTQPKRTTTGDP